MVKGKPDLLIKKLNVTSCVELLLIIFKTEFNQSNMTNM